MATDETVGGADTWDDIAEYGETKEAFLRRVLPLANGVSSADTLARVFAKPDPARFVRAFGWWMAAACYSCCKGSPPSTPTHSAVALPIRFVESGLSPSGWSRSISSRFWPMPGVR